MKLLELYVHKPKLAPTQEMLNAYKKQGAPWDDYERQFNELIEQRRVEEEIDRELLIDGCLLCSEHEPEHCHRRLIAEYFGRRWNDVEIIHLK